MFCRLIIPVFHLILNTLSLKVQFFFLEILLISCYSAYIEICICMLQYSQYSFNILQFWQLQYLTYACISSLNDLLKILSKLGYFEICVHFTFSDIYPTAVVVKVRPLGRHPPICNLGIITSAVCHLQFCHIIVGREASNI